MGERKVLNKYIPSDFDPRLVPRSKKPKDDLVPVRMMLPFSVQCESCNTFLYRGRKFNSKKEKMGGSDGKYLGIQRYRFYIKCTHCSKPITFLTDPKNTDYEMESGGTRNYDVWKDRQRFNLKEEENQKQDEKLDPMKALENRVLNSQREMEEMDALDEIKALNMRHKQLMSYDGDVTHLISRNNKNEDEKVKVSKEESLNENGLTESEEALVQSIRFGSSSKASFNKDQQKQEDSRIKRINDDDEYDHVGLDSNTKRKKRKKKKKQKEQQQQQDESFSNSTMETENEKVVEEEKLESQSKPDSTIVPLIQIKRKKRRIVHTEDKNRPSSQLTSLTIKSNNEEKGKCADNSGGGLAGLLGDYGSDSDSDSD